MGERGKREAEAMAERWQGRHGSYYGGAGLLKHADRGDYVEVKRDYAREKELAERFDEAQRGNPQKYLLQWDTQYTPL